MPQGPPKHCREELHWLVVLSLLNAPYDDEPETEDERAAVEVARGEPGPGTPHADVLREFGL